MKRVDVRSTKLKKNDIVKVISGRSRGKSGKILRIINGNNQVIVEGLNIVKKAMRRKRQEDRGGIADIEAPIHISNVMPITRAGKQSRVTIDVVSKQNDAKKSHKERVRLLTKTGEKF